MATHHTARRAGCRFARALAALSVALLLAGAPEVAAQNLDPVFAIRVSEECGGSEALSALRDALELRVPEADYVGRPSGADATINWRPDQDGCGVLLRAGETETIIPLPPSPDEATLHGAAARIAWVTAVSMGADPFALPDDEEPPSDLAPPEPPPEPEPEPTAERHVPVAASLVPSMNLPRRADRDATRSFSFNLVLGRSAGITGAEIGLMANHTGALTGGQVAFGYNRASGGIGAQFSGGANVVDGSFTGMQFGLVNIAGLGVAASETPKLTGGQWSLVNVARDVDGGQFGLLNRARDVRGVQMGLVNVARRGSVSFGIINVVRTEPLRPVVVGSDNGLLEVGVRHGSTAVQNILMLGVGPVGGDAFPTLTWGIGGHVPIGSRFFADIDLLVTAVFRPSPPAGSSNYAGTMLRTRVSLGWQIAPRVAVFGGVSQSALFVTEEDRLGLVWSRATPIDVSGSFVYLWPTFHGGLRF